MKHTIETKWEYRVAYLSHRGGNKLYSVKSGKHLWEIDLEEELNDQGKEGWEIVYFPPELLNGHADAYGLFKRKIRYTTNET